MKKLSPIFTLLVFSLILMFFVSPTYAAITSLDTTFNSVGYTTHNNAAGGNGVDVALDSIVDSAGRYVVVGYSRNASGNDDMVIWRYLSNGTLDTSFNGVGYVVYSGTSGDFGRSIIQDSAGRYVITGTSSYIGGEPYGSEICGDCMTVWRYNQNGTLDTTFNEIGFMPYSFLGGVGDKEEHGYDIIQDSSGRYLVTGYIWDGDVIVDDDNPVDDLVVWRITSTGVIDTTFNGIGYSRRDGIAGYSSTDRGYSVIQDSSGRYVVAGIGKVAPYNYEAVILRYLETGALDTSFNGTGYNSFGGVTSGIEQAYSVNEDSSGRYVLAGTSDITAGGNQDMTIWRYLSNGTLDTSFNTVGYVTHNGAAGGSGNDYGYSIDIDAAGKYVVTGSSLGSTTSDDMVIWKYNTDATLDTTFNGVGYVSHNAASGYTGNDGGRSILVDTSNGKYFVAGYSTNATTTLDLSAWRYTNLYQISNLDMPFDAIVSLLGNIEVGTSVGVYGVRTVDVYYDGYPLVSANANFVEDLDWSSLDGGVDFVGYRSYANQITAVQGYTQLVSLFVPYRSGDNQVGICPDAASLSSVNETCPGLYYLSTADSGVSIVTLDEVDYWMVNRDLGDAGGFSHYLEQVVEEEELAETGQSTYQYILVGLAGLAGIVLKLKKNSLLSL
ncbi:hypothetical protein JW887_05950 [Candidatus Dojkabacteria bacterium]|nr:hypothetical protein [Candidatus Dojkabacteria bacterium]